MTQKLLVMERQDRETLMNAIKKDILEADNNSRISAISVNKTLLSMEAWIVLEVPENKDKLYETAAGFESEEDRLTRITGVGTDF